MDQYGATENSTPCPKEDYKGRFDYVSSTSTSPHRQGLTRPATRCAAQLAQATAAEGAHEPGWPDEAQRLGQAHRPLQRHVPGVRESAQDSAERLQASRVCTFGLARQRRDTTLTRPQTPETEHLAYSARVPDESRMVKAFTRSSAGADVELVIDIRNPAACLVSHA